MDNEVRLTDHELSVIMTSLQMSIMSYEKYKEQNGGSEIDFNTRQTVQEMKKLHEKLNKEYF